MDLAPRRLAAAIVAAACLAAAAPAAAAPQDDWRALSQRIAQPWPGVQAADGQFPDYVIRTAPNPTRDRYGEALLGYGLIQNGIREGDDRQASAGLRSVTFAARKRDAGWQSTQFENFALASAYNLARERLADHPLFVQGRADIEERLRHSRLTRIGPERRFTNKALVAAVEVLELARSGLRSDDPRAILNDPAAAVTAARELIGDEVPRLARPHERHNASAGSTTMLGDYPWLPLAYHGLTVGYLARAIELLGADAPARARSTLLKGMNATWALTAPDGDLSFHGRSQEQAWTHPITAYGAEVAAALSPSNAARYQAISDRAIGRLADAYDVRDDGLAITPAVGADLGGGVRGLDIYAAASPYNGLTLVSLNWALERVGSRAASSARIGSDTRGAAILGNGGASFATARKGNVWFAVKRSRAGTHDLRYDFGLVALKVRGSDGEWRDVLRLRPRVQGTNDTAGPVLLLGGQRGLPEGGALSVTRNGRVQLTVNFKTTRGRVLRRRVPCAFVPTRDGVRIDFRAREGDRYEHSSFFLDAPGRPRVESDAVRDELQSVSFGRPASVRFQDGYSSGLDPQLVRARAVMRARAGTVSIAIAHAR